jgi:AraC family L-rhamnose operon regulatory protein RhaS
MVRPAPVFTSAADRYRADTCTELAAAERDGQVRVEALVHGHYPGRPMQPNALTGVKTVGFWDAPTDQTWGLDWHRNEGIELTLLERGSVAFATDTHACQLRPGDLTVTRPWQQHRVGAPHVRAGKLHWLILDVGVRRPHQTWTWPAWLILTRADLQELTRLLRHNEHPVWHASGELRRCFAQISSAVAADREGNMTSALKVRINELFLLLLELLRSQELTLDASLSDTQRTVELFLMELRDNVDQLSREWTLRLMAKASGLGVTQFVYYCRQLTNMTPLQFLNLYRLQHAAQILVSDQEQTVTEIADRCGFRTSQYFATVFRKHFGMSPLQYRKR